MLVQRAYRFDKEESIVWEQIPSNLDQIEPQASNFASAKQQALQHEAEAQAAGRIEREISRLGDFYDYKELAAKDKVEATRTTLARHSGERNRGSASDIARMGGQSPAR